MAAQTYQSPVLNTQAKRQAAYERLSELLMHLRNGSAANGYTMDMTSAIFDGGTQRISVVLTAPLPSQEQVDRYNLTAVP